MKARIYTVNGYTCEIVGASNNCILFVDGKHSGTAFDNVRFTSIRAARIRFMQWVKNKTQNNSKP